VGENDSITPPAGIMKYVRKLKHGQVFTLRKKHELATPETKSVLATLF
jgi:hypothetical protein